MTTKYLRQTAVIPCSIALGRAGTSAAETISMLTYFLPNHVKAVVEPQALYNTTNLRVRPSVSSDFRPRRSRT